MFRPLTAEDLAQYRRCRIRYLRYGRRAFRGEAWTEYQDMNHQVREAVERLPDRYRSIAQLYYISGLPCVVVARRTYYSERHVRRLRDGAAKEIIRA